MLGGKSRKIKGQVTFFPNNQQKMNGTLSSLNKQFIYVAMSGRFTLEQRALIKQRMSLDVNQYKRLMTWLKNHGDPSIYAEIDVENPPKPIFLENEVTTNSTDESEDPNFERQFNLCFSMPSNYSPTQQTGTFVTEGEFAKAIINGNTSPTVEVFGTTFEQDHRIKIEHALPYQFPFGVGGFDELRENRVSKTALLSHFQDICLPAFRRQDFALISNHFYNRIKSYEMASLRLKSKVLGTNKTQAEQISTISCNDLLLAVERKAKNLRANTNNPADKTLQTIEASTKEIPHSREAAMKARKNILIFFMQPIDMRN